MVEVWVTAHHAGGAGFFCVAGTSTTVIELDSFYDFGNWFLPLRRNQFLRCSF